MDKFVEVRKMIGERNPTLLKWTPGFVLRWVEKIIHQEEVNDFMFRHRDASAYEFCRDCMDEFNVELDIRGIENVPQHPNNCIFASNHPLGGFDALAIVAGLHDVRPDIHFIVNDFLLHVRNLKERFIGVNLVGKNAVESLQRVEEQFASDKATFIFPAGLVSRKIDGEIMDLEWKKTFVSKAKKYDKPVVPVHITGQLTKRFYRLSKFRRAIGIKVNIEMFYLVDELYKQKNTKMKIVIGKPIAPETFDKSKNDKAWAQEVKNQVYKLGKGKEIKAQEKSVLK